MGLKKVGVGLLGAGFAAEFHMMCYTEIHNADAVAVASRTESRADSFAKKWGITKVYHGEDAMEKLCKDPGVELVDITYPNFLHKAAAICAAENRKHVICEKPLARNPKEAGQMLNSVEKSGVIHGYAENQVFMPQLVRVREFVDVGAIGRVFWTRSREAHFGPHSAWFWNPKLAGGGVLMDMGCHSVEVARYLIGGNPVEALAWGATLVHETEAEDNSLLCLRYKDGEFSQCENSWAAHGGLDLRYEVYGSDGAVFVDATRETGIRVFTVAPEAKVGYVVEKAEAKKGWMHPIWREHEVYGYLAELQHFVNCVTEDETPRETFRDGYIVNLILDAGYQSIKSGKWEKNREAR